MPAWAQIVVGAAAVVTALTVLWTKVLHPGAKLISAAEEMLPLLRELTSNFKDSPNSFAILQQIVQQFRTNSGSSMRDVINRLELAANENRHAAEVLKVNVEVAKQLAEQDRQQIARLMILLDRLDAKVSHTVASVDRVEEARQEAQERADSVLPGLPEGAAADAASKSPPEDGSRDGA